MNKGLLIGGGLVAGFVIYKVFMNKQATQTIGPDQQLGNVPANTVGTSRQDNANQPWYNNQAIQKKVEQYKSNPAQALEDVNSVVHSLTDIWGSVKGFFGNDTVQGTDDVPDLSDTFGGYESNFTFDLPDWGTDQSDIFGDMSFSDYGLESSYDLSWDNDDFGLVDASNSDWSFV